MSQVVLSIGSNIEPHLNIPRGLTALYDAFGALALSPWYESRSVGFAGDNFINLVAAFDSGQSLGALAGHLAAIEAAVGRTPQQKGFSARTLDLDLLIFGDFVGDWNGRGIPSADLLDYAFVLRPLAGLLPHQRHPTRGRSFAALWRDFPHKAAQPLWPSSLQWKPSDVASSAMHASDALCSAAGSVKPRRS